MKKLLWLAAGAAPLALACPALADEQVTVPSYNSPGPIYVELAAGSAQTVKIGNGPLEVDGELAISAAAGVRFGDQDGVGVRVQGEFNRAEASLGPINGAVTTYGGSVLLDLPIGDRLKVAGGGGLDLGEGSIDNFGSEDGDGWHYVLQGEYALSDAIGLVVGYRNTSMDFDGVEVDMETVTAGLRFSL